MKYGLWIIVLINCCTGLLQSQPQFEMSRNVYRVPYGNGATVVVTNDHFNHNPPGRYDMHGEDNGSSCSINYPILAAAAGIVRRIVDSHAVHGPDCDEGDNCQNYNNYVWVEHANGEWTKYTHMLPGSSTILAGLTLNECVSAGQLLGYECEIGHASGPHLHFEVRHPNDPANIQIDVAGGFMHDAPHRIPVFCGLVKNYFESGDEIVAASCGSCNISENYFFSNITFGTNKVYAKVAGGTIGFGTNTTFNSTSSSVFKANGGVTIRPGVLIRQGAYFQAKIGGCGTTAFVCN